MRISLLVPIIDPLIVNKFTDIPLWYICISFSPAVGYDNYQYNHLWSWCVFPDGRAWGHNEFTVTHSYGRKNATDALRTSLIVAT